MRNDFAKKMAAIVMCGAVAVTSVNLPQRSVKAEGVDTSDWKTSIAIDFGITEAHKDTVTDEATGETTIISDLALDSQLQLKKQFGSDFDMAEPKEGFGNMLYSRDTVQDVYGTEAGVKQKMGFDKIVPAGEVDGTCGEYFRDWVFSPDGEEYSFSVDLPVGQYHVAIYTGNKIKGYNNTTCVQFNDEAYMVGEESQPVFYEQTSEGSRQFYIPNRDNDNKVEKVTSYIVDVKDNGNGYGTLKATFFDNTENEASHLVKVSDESNSDVMIKMIDTYEGTDDVIDKDSIADKIVTARLNGIEIAPVENPVHATRLEAEPVDVEMEDIKPIVVDMGAEDVTDRVFYRSSNPEVVDVDNYYGEVTAKGTGTATIYAYNSYLDEVKAIPYNIVTRKTIELQSQNAENNEITLIMGEEGRNIGSVIAKFNSAENDIVEWSVSDSEVIKLGTPVYEKKGEEATSTVEIEALKSGSATITAKRKDNEERVAQMSVNVINATKSVVFTDKDGKELEDDAVLSVEEGSSIEVDYVVGPENATQKEVTAECADTSIAGVSVTNGKVVIRGKKPGETTVKIMTKYSNDINDTVTVKVTAKPVEPTITPSPAPESVTTATPTPVPQITATETSVPDVTPAVKKSVTLSGKAVTKISRNKSVSFKVSAKGTTVNKVSYKIKSGKKLVKVTASKKAVKITAKKKGTVKLVITVSAKGVTKKFNRTIKVK